MVNRVFVTPSEVRGYGNIISEKTTDDFSLYQSSLVLADNVYTLSYNAGVTVSLGLSSSTVSYGTSVTLTATVLDGGSPVASGGTVTFYDGTTSLGTGTTGSDGKATLSKSDFSVGSHTLKAVYSTVNSSTVSLTVNKITSTISLSATSSSITVGSNAELSGTLSVGSGKTVTIYQNGSSIGTVTTGTNGAFTKSVSGLSAGTYSFTAGYAGDDTHTNVTSTAVSVTVTAITVSSVTLASNKDILSYADSDSCTLSATVVGSDSNPMSGVSVEFFKGSTSLGTSTTNSSGVATKSYSSVGAGDISFTAKCGSVVSETFVISDYFKYDDATSDKSSNYGLLDNPTFTYNSAGYYTISVGGFLNVAKVEDNCQYEVMIRPTSTYNCGIDVTNDGSQYDTRVINYSTANTHFLAKIENGFNNINSRSRFIQPNTWYKFIIQRNGTTLTAKVEDTNGNSLWSASTTYTWSNHYFRLGLFTTNTSFDFKNVIIKPL